MACKDLVIGMVSGKMRIGKPVVFPNDSNISGWWLSHPSEKYELVSWDDDIPNIWKNKSCSKPPTRYSIHVILPFDLSLSVKHSINAERHNIKR